MGQPAGFVASDVETVVSGALSTPNTSVYFFRVLALTEDCKIRFTKEDGTSIYGTTGMTVVQGLPEYFGGPAGMAIRNDGPGDIEVAAIVMPLS